MKVPALHAWRSPIDAINRAARRAVGHRLASLDRGQVTLRDAAGESTFGRGGDLRATIEVHDVRVFRHAALGGTLAIAESYLRGEWDADDLTTLLRIFARNRATTDRLERTVASRAANTVRRLGRLRRDNTRRGSRRNISAHYDLGNDFFQLWLDPTMAYSSALFPTTEATLEEASLEKFDRVCRQLALKPSDEVLEIGGGWGGFAIYAADNYGCRVTTTTISNEQFEFAGEAIADAGLASRIRLLKEDYRDLTGQFDKLVSIEMVEAVGPQRLDDYFRQCSRLLRPDGSMVIQAIVMPEQGYREYLKSVDFIQKYVFPGGRLPSVGAILASVGRATDLRLASADDFAPHYAETLRRWRRAFHARLDEVRRWGHSEQFIRLWSFYLCSCEAAFEERTIGLVQMQFDKPECRRDRADLSFGTAVALPRRATLHVFGEACTGVAGCQS